MFHGNLPGLWNVDLTVLVKNHTANVAETLQKQKQFVDVVGDVALVGVDLFQMFLKNFADSFHALLDGLNK